MIAPKSSPASGERREARHEEVEAREGHHVHGQLSQVRVQLPGEAQAGCDSGHCDLLEGIFRSLKGLFMGIISFLGH